MLENFSVGAQRVVSLATTEAQRLDHPRVGTEHLLLGVLADEGEPADALRAAGASLAAARHKVAEVMGPDAGAVSSDALGLTPRAQRALDRAGRFSRREKAPEVTAAHLLLGVLDVEGLACQVLRGLGVDIDQVRNAMFASPAHIPVALVDDDSSVAETRPHCPNCRAALDDTLSETLISARRDGEQKRRLSVVYCTACGATLGVVRP